LLKKIKGIVHFFLLVAILVFVYRLSTSSHPSSPLVSFEKRYHQNVDLEAKIEKYLGTQISHDTMYSYIPAYSHIYLEKGTAKEFAVTLSLRNIDMENSIKILEVFYFDTKGKLLRKYFPEGRVLGPLETTEIFIKSEDLVGGSGANFSILFQMPKNTLAPIFESVMISNVGGSFSFSSRGVIYSAKKL